MTLKAGTRLGRYEVIECLGQGGMGEVYRANDDRLRRHVALKVLRGDDPVSPEIRRRLAREAEMLARVNHPNICTLYDFETANGLDFLVMEYLQGQSLAHLLATHRIPMHVAVRYAIDIGEGLAAAHRLGLVHRDLKPSNVFVTKGGTKLLDFGIALWRSPVQNAPSNALTPWTPTPDGVVLGTPAYMAPEVLRGERPDQKSDLFSYGALLFEMITGQPAFRGSSWAEIVTDVLTRELPALRTVMPDVPAALEQLVADCLRKETHERWESAHDAALMLRAVHDGHGGAVGTGIRPHSTIHRLTFQRGTIYSARFSPEAANVLYSAAWNGLPIDLFLTRRDSPESRPFGLRDANLLSVSSSGNLALALDVQFKGLARSGVLAQVAFAGAQPRRLSSDVVAADWLRDPERLFIVRRRGARCQLEWPIGKVRYETEALISHARVSQDGRLVAFVHHPHAFDHGGAVAVMEEGGSPRLVSDGWSSIWGLAWSPDGREVWFTASKEGSNRSLRAASLAGEERILAEMTGSLTLHDVAPNGDVLVSEDIVRTGVVFKTDDGSVQRDMTWLDATFPRDLSNDGTLLLFDETGDGGGPAYSSYVRATTGAPAVRLGNGFAHSLSPDKQYAITVSRSLRGGLLVIPLGPGDPMTLQHANLDEYQWSKWLPDGRRIVVNAIERGSGPRLFVHDLGSGEITAISRTNVLGPAAVAPDGQRVLGIDAVDRSTWIFAVDGRQPSLCIPDITPDDLAFQWSVDGHAVYLRRRGGELPLRVMRMDLSSGQRDVWREVTIADPAGVHAISDMVLTPDGRNYVIAYSRILSDLFVVTGVG